MKTSILSFVMIAAFGITSAQSLKSNTATLPYSIAKNRELTGYKTYHSKLITTVPLLTDSQSKTTYVLSYGESDAVKARNDAERIALANQYLTMNVKGLTKLKVFGELAVELTTTDLTFNRVIEDLASAKEDDVVAHIVGNAQLTVRDVKGGKSLYSQKVEIPAEEAALTKSKIITLSPGIAVELKLSKKADTVAINKQLTEALNNTRLYYINYLLEQAGCMLKAEFEDQKGVFTMPLYYVKGKEDYSELEKTSESFKGMVTGLKAQSSSALKASAANDIILKSIEIWEKEVAAKSEETEARINEEIARGLYLNLAVAYLMLGENEKATYALSKTNFVIAEGTVLSGTGTAKEYFIKIRSTLNRLKAAPDKIVFDYK